MVNEVKLTDREVEALWESFGDIPMDPETECMEDSFHIWKVGTPREDIWRWFDENHSKGVAYLLYGVDTVNSNVQSTAKRLLELDALCEECTSKYCAYCDDGFCRYPMVRGKSPEMADDGQCLGYVFSDSF